MSRLHAQKALLDARRISQELGAPVVAAAFDRAGSQVAFALGDGTLRLDRLAVPEEWSSVAVHDGAILTLAPDVRQSGFISGGDDGQFARVTDNQVITLANFGSRWVEHAASFSDSKAGMLACTAGKFVHLFSPEGEKLKSLEHPSTVTGIAFDGKGKRIVASHYDGASLWFVGSTANTPRRLEWKGSHTNVALHPAGDAVVTAMQENALHGWRLADAHDMRMSGYPTKPESLGFTRSGKYLASSGADSIVLWPFFGGGPMGKPPVELAQMEAMCTRVACHPLSETVAAGYADGSVILADIATRLVSHIAPAGHGPISALAWGGDGAWLAFGTEHGFAALVGLA